MAYTPNPYDTTQPTADKYVESAAAEFRALKAAVALLANGAANYEGVWSTLTGALAAGKVVFHDSTTWLALVPIADVTASEPDLLNPDWWDLGGVRRSGDVMSGGLTVPQLNGGALAGFRNIVINGGMRVATDGSSFAVPGGSSSYTLGQWFAANGTNGAFTVSQGAALTEEGTNQLRVTVTTVDGTIAAGEQAQISTFLEGQFVRKLFSRASVLSFKVKSPKAGQHYVAVRNAGADRSYVLPFTISAANTEEYKQLQLPPLSSVVGGTWNWTTGVGLSLGWALVTGATYQSATVNAWVAGNYVAGTGQQNLLDTLGAVFELSDVQLETGTVATPFEQRPIQLEELLCMRYGEQQHIVFSHAPSTQYQTHQWRVPKRVPPVLTTTLLEGAGAPTVVKVASSVLAFYQNSAPTGTGTLLVVGNSRL